MGRPALLLRLEGLVLLAVSVGAYRSVYAFPWSWLLLGLLLPDLGALGYLAGKRVGSYTYNMTHTTTLPLALLAGVWGVGGGAWVAIPLIWMAHIGMDRAMGYGLKYPTDFKDTQLQKLG
jgi:hypothetical protein